jgi:predicted O-methyltransferase YrrM
MKLSISLPTSRYRRLNLMLSRQHRILLPEVSPGQLLGENFAVRFIDAGRAGGNVKLQELLFICALAQKVGAAKIFEFGTFDGKTSATLAVNLPAAEIYTIDLPASEIDALPGHISGGDRRLIEKEVIGDYLRLTDGRVQQLYGDTMTYDFTAFRGQFDFVFIDANHRYDFVLKDSRNALSLLKPGGGTILWHDYGSLKGVTRAVHHLFENDSDFANLKFVQSTTLAILQR